jgi:hypothetical protein
MGTVDKVTGAELIFTRAMSGGKDSTNYTNAYIKVNTFVKKHK